MPSPSSLLSAAAPALLPVAARPAAPLASARPAVPPVAACPAAPTVSTVALRATSCAAVWWSPVLAAAWPPVLLTTGAASETALCSRCRHSSRCSWRTLLVCMARTGSTAPRWEGCTPGVPAGGKNVKALATNTTTTGSATILIEEATLARTELRTGSRSSYVPRRSRDARMPVSGGCNARTFESESSFGKARVGITRKRNSHLRRQTTTANVYYPAIPTHVLKCAPPRVSSASCLSIWVRERPAYSASCSRSSSASPATSGCSARKLRPPAAAARWPAGEGGWERLGMCWAAVCQSKGYFKASLSQGDEIAVRLLLCEPSSALHCNACKLETSDCA